MAAGGNMKKKGYAAGGVGMKKKMMAAGGMPMAKDPKTGKMMPSFAMDGVGKMAKGGSAMYKKGYAAGGVAMKKLFAGGYALSEKSGSKVKSRFSKDEDKTPMKRKSDYQKAGEKLTKTKTRSGISAKDNTSSSYNASTRSYPGAGVRKKSTTTSEETAAQKKARLAKAAKIKAAKVAKEKARKEKERKAKRDKERKIVKPSAFNKVLSVLGGVRPTSRKETNAEMKARLLKEKKATEKAKKNKNKKKPVNFNVYR